MRIRTGNKPAAANRYVPVCRSLITDKYLCATVIDLVHPWASNVFGIGLLGAFASLRFGCSLVVDLQWHCLLGLGDKNTPSSLQPPSNLSTSIHALARLGRRPLVCRPARRRETHRVAVSVPIEMSTSPSSHKRGRERDVDAVSSALWVRMDKEFLATQGLLKRAKLLPRLRSAGPSAADKKNCAPALASRRSGAPAVVPSTAPKRETSSQPKAATEAADRTRIAAPAANTKQQQRAGAAAKNPIPPAVRPSKNLPPAEAPAAANSKQQQRAGAAAKNPIPPAVRPSKNLPPAEAPAAAKQQHPRSSVQLLPRRRSRRCLMRWRSQGRSSARCWRRWRSRRCLIRRYTHRTSRPHASRTCRDEDEEAGMVGRPRQALQITS
jgi:hypothetical protein